MTTRHLAASALALTLALVAGLTGTALAWTGEESRPAVTYEGGTPEQLAMVEWAVGLYEQADLPLPGLDIAFFDDRSHCSGYLGSATPVGDRTEVRLCTTEAGSAQEWLVVHELAHAWDRHFSDPDRRAAFLDLRGLEGWRTGDWHLRGAEQAAEIMVWALMDRPVVPLRIDQNSCAELLAGYQTLTGQAPLHGLTDAC